MARGFTRKVGIDYFNTYTPVAHISIIKVTVTLVSIDKLKIHQIDVKTTFLNSESVTRMKMSTRNN